MESIQIRGRMIRLLEIEHGWMGEGRGTHPIWINVNSISTVETVHRADRSTFVRIRVLTTVGSFSSSPRPEVSPANVGDLRMHRIDVQHELEDVIDAIEKGQIR